MKSLKNYKNLIVLFSASAALSVVAFFTGSAVANHTADTSGTTLSLNSNDKQCPAKNDSKNQVYFVGCGGFF